MRRDAIFCLLLMLRHSCLNLWPSPRCNPKRLALLLATNFLRCPKKKKKKINTTDKLRLRCESNFHWVGVKSDNRWCCIFCSCLFLRIEDPLESACVWPLFSAAQLQRRHTTFMLSIFSLCVRPLAAAAVNRYRTQTREEKKNAEKNQLALQKLWCSTPKSTAHSDDKRERWLCWSTYKHNKHTRRTFS